MVVGESPEWLPPGFVVKVKYKNGRRIKYYLDVTTGAKYHHKKNVIQCDTASNNVHGTPQAMEEGCNGLSSCEKGETALVRTDDLSEYLPRGWEVEEKTLRRSSRRKGSPSKVYIESSSGRRFYSREAVAKYMITMHRASTIAVDNRVDAVDNPSPDTPQVTSNTDEGSASKKKQKAKSFKMVAVETMVDDDLPPGWIKEIRTSKSERKIRRDPFYIDPVTGYVLRSKKDVQRYLKTNDIRNCAIRPLKRELYDLKKNDTPSSNPATEKSQDYKRELVLSEESIDGRGTCTKNLAESDTNVLEHTPAISASDSVKVTSVGVASSAVDLKMTVDATTCSPVIDPLPIKEVFSGNGTHEQAGETQVGTRSRSKKRKGSILPSRSSKRLAGLEPDMSSNIALSKSSVGATVRSSESNIDPFPSLKEASASVTLPPNIEPKKETAEAHISKKPLREAERVDKIEIPKSEKLAAAEKQLDGSNRILQEAGNDKQLDGSNIKSQESQFFSEFGESWSDPTLEFAIKTLRGEIPIEETLKFTSCFGEPFNICNMGSGSLKSMEPQAPINFQNEFVPGSDNLKQPGSTNHLPVNSPVSEYFKQPGPINQTPVNTPGYVHFKQPGPINHMPVNTPGSIYFKQPGPINHMPVNMPGSVYFKQPGQINHLPVNLPSFGATQMPGGSLSFLSPGNISFSTCNHSNGQSSTDAGEKGLLHKPRP